MSTKRICDYKLTFRPDITYWEEEEHSWWDGEMGNKIWQFSVGRLGIPSSSRVVYQGTHWSKDVSAYRKLVTFLDIKDITFDAKQLREYEGSETLKRILRSFDGFYFRIADYQEYTSTIDFTNLMDDKSQFFSRIDDSYRVRYEWNTNRYGKDEYLFISKEECWYIKLIIRLCFLQNLTYLSGDDYMEYMKFKYNEDCIDRAVKLGWIVQ